MKVQKGKKKAACKATRPPKGKDDGFGVLIIEVRDLIRSARHVAASTVNTLQVLTNFEIGRRIVEHEQKGEKRAEYGVELIKALSAKLGDEFGKGFSERNLRNFRAFFLAYQARAPEIWQTVSAKTSTGQIAQTVSAQSVTKAIRQAVSAKSTPRASSKRQTTQFVTAPTTENFRTAFPLSWSHYVLLLTIQDPDERNFYEIESASENWSLATLKRQVASSLYERLALSRKKSEVRKLAAEGQIITRPEDILKEPYVLEFLGLDEKADYSESDLEQLIIDRIEQFLLELGKGFLFEARQQRFTFDEDHFYVDLVFYNRLLRCHVLIDLKLDKITHQDLGQMQMYVNYYNRHVRLPDENPAIGILLCKRKKDAIVELTLPPDANIHAKEYKLYLPSKKVFQEKLMEWAEA
ncbi:MAG: DUF1016 family protein [Candidatus Hydrogenedentes bacterium]|nr:DUF1016 family protein [Candidatus Hydrogenedentota bacterium]